jgi:hypothetical protein
MMKIKKSASRSSDPVVAARELQEAIAQPDISFALFFCSPDYDLQRLATELRTRFEGVDLVGCTTAGEITPVGYLNGAITGVSIAAPDLVAVSQRIDTLRAFEIEQGAQLIQSLLGQLEQRGARPSPENTFAFLQIDGLSQQEEAVVSALYGALGGIQLFGGSAGDGVRFESTHVYHDGAFHGDSAVLTLVHTDHPFVVFKTEHFVNTSNKMVVTQADPGRRIVTEINGEPAGREYAEQVGLEVDKLTPMIFAAHPVVVKVGGTYYVRSIQKVNEDESLTFFCAIDEGIVLTVARGLDMLENLEQLFERLHNQIGCPELVLGCDCILRRLELDQRGITAQAGELFAANNVIGFSTYGEQFNGMHVNQTFTGVAIGARRSGS